MKLLHYIPHFMRNHKYMAVLCHCRPRFFELSSRFEAVFDTNSDIEHCSCSLILTSAFGIRKMVLLPSDATALKQPSGASTLSCLSNSLMPFLICLTAILSTSDGSAGSTSRSAHALHLPLSRMKYVTCTVSDVAKSLGADGASFWKNFSNAQ